MKNIIRALFIIILGVWVLIGNILAACLLIKFGLNDVVLLMTMLYTIIGSTIIYIVIFRYFMLMKVYNIKISGNEKILIETQFKKIIISRVEILSKKTCFWGAYKIKVKHDEKTRCLFVPHDMGVYI